MTGHSVREVRRRRRYSKAFKREVVKEASAPGNSVAAVARRHGLNANMVFIWRRDPRFADPWSDPVFLPVEIGATNAPRIAGAGVGEPSAAKAEIVLRLGCGTEVVCRGVPDEDALDTVVRVLRRIG